MIVTCICCFSWSTFWTALTAVGTIAMAIITYCTLSKNDGQVAEMKHQWEEDNKPYLDVRLVYEHSLSSTASRYLLIENYGKGTATDIQISFEDKFIENISIQELQKQIKALQSRTYKVLPGRSNKEIFCDIIDLVNSGKSRISVEEFDLTKRSALLEYLNKPIKVDVKYKWNGKSYYETMIMNYK